MISARALAPDGVNPDRGPLVLGIDSTVFGIATLMILLRLYTRTWITRNLGWDDATIILAGLTNSVGLSFYICMVFFGLGRHLYTLRDYDQKELLKFDYLDWIQTFITLAISKISICLLLLRLSKFSKLRTVLYTLIAFLFVTHFPLLVLFIAQCNPTEKAWNTGLNGKCFSKQTVSKILIAQGVFSILTDFVGAAFPVLLLWDVKIKLNNKIAIWLLMGFGIITAIACIVRTSLTYQIASPDTSWDGVGISLAKAVEVNCGIIAACLPIMKPLYGYLRCLYLGIPYTNRSASTGAQTRSSRTWLRGPWSRPRGSRSTNTSYKDNKSTQHLGSAATPEALPQSMNRQYTWRKPTPKIPSQILRDNGQKSAKQNPVDLTALDPVEDPGFGGHPTSPLSKSRNSPNKEVDCNELV